MLRVFQASSTSVSTFCRLSSTRSLLKTMQGWGMFDDRPTQQDDSFPRLSHLNFSYLLFTTSCSIACFSFDRLIRVPDSDFDTDDNLSPSPQSTYLPPSHSIDSVSNHVQSTESVHTTQTGIARGEEIATGFNRVDELYRSLVKHDKRHELKTRYRPYKSGVEYGLVNLWLECDFSRSQLDSVIVLLDWIRDDNIDLSADNMPTNGKAVAMAAMSALPNIHDLASFVFFFPSFHR